MDYKTKKIILILITAIVFSPIFSDVGNVFSDMGNALMTVFIILFYFIIQEDFEFKDEKMLINNGFNVESIKHYVIDDKIRLILIISTITCALPLIYDKIPILPEFYYIVFIGILLHMSFSGKSII